MNSKPLALIILDGWGIAPQDEFNAISQANTPNWDRFNNKYPHTKLNASGPSVGLPESQMGNSEVGHMAIGAGRVIKQDLSRINEAALDGNLNRNTQLTNIALDTKANNKCLHIMGLLSPGGIHSNEQHLIALLNSMAAHKVENIVIHAFLDGRDTPPISAKNSLELLQDHLTKLNIGTIGSIHGRFYAMDRDNRYERTKTSYDLLTTGTAKYTAANAISGLEASYARDETDEFVYPTLINPAPPIKHGDNLIFFNFRADRARQLCYALTDNAFTGFDRETRPKVNQFVTFTQYAKDLNTIAAFPKPVLTNIFADVCEAQNLTQLRVAETEKYAHVTFFFNGGKEEPYPNESRVLIPSPKVQTYDLTPKMRAPEICSAVVSAVEGGEHHVIIANFANPDMIGHTGNLPATIEAIEYIDECLGNIENAIIKSGGTCLITADHGNADCMFNEKTKQPHTAHTTALVPLLMICDTTKGLKFGSAIGGLADIAPTMLKLLDINQPEEMTGANLLLD